MRIIARQHSETVVLAVGCTGMSNGSVLYDIEFLPVITVLEYILRQIYTCMYLLLHIECRRVVAARTRNTHRKNDHVRNTIEHDI
jgi:hypothetical protein